MVSQQEPIPVEIIKPSVQDVNVVHSDIFVDVKRRPEPSMVPSRPPTTTLEEDIRTQSQRDLNMTWENTQSLISKIVVVTTCIGALISLCVKAFFPERPIAFPPEWWAIVGLVIGFYFGRTNHARTSEVSPFHGRVGVNASPLDDRA